MSGSQLSNRSLRAIALGLALAIGLVVFLLGDAIHPRARAAAGVVCFLAIVTACSRNPSGIRWPQVLWGIGIQLALAVFILRLEIGGWRPGYALFVKIAEGVKRFLEFTTAGASFVFGGLADPQAMSKLFPGGFVFAFMGLPTIIFVSSFFTILYYFGILQFVVRLMARGMMRLMRTSGAETLSAAANVFMGQTEAPLIIKPYLARMTESELLATMAGGLATISGGMMAVYIAIGADPVAILTTSVMAAPCGLYLSKILLPETGTPETQGRASTVVERTHVNVVDAAAAGASDGMMLALNVAAMLIAFLALLAAVDYVLGAMHAGWSMSAFFAHVFAPAAMLIGVPAADVPAVADLLGTKLVANEFVAFVKLTTEYKATISPEAFTLATYVLTGFANFGSIGIQIGGISAIAPTRRGDLARLGGLALLAGFLATMINAAIAAILV